MKTFKLKKTPNQIELSLLSLINKGFELSKPSEYLKYFVEKLSPTSIRIGDYVIDLSVSKLYVIGWGKVTGAMAQALESILGSRIIEDGIVVTSNPEYLTNKIKILEGTHPLPSEKNIKATEEILSLAETCSDKDYVICLVSGGGSSILCLPAGEISLDDKISSTITLLKEGIEVEHINRIRKHISEVKGGKLAKAIHPAQIFNLIISDDIYDEVHSISSGPTVPDPITFKDAQKVISDHSLRTKLPSSVTKYIDENVNKVENETLKPEDIKASNISNHLVFRNKDFRNNLRIAALSKYENVFVYPSTLSGDFDDAIEKYNDFISEINPDSDFVVIAGGEIELKNRSDGLGGRSQHFAAAMIPILSKYRMAAFAAIASDGHDYLTGIGGALITNQTQKIMNTKGIPYKSYFEAYQSFKIHNEMFTHLMTIKPTQTNVFDAYIFLHLKS
tara:strand:- start:937 stop:2280 length:1344 start_codon:yes stop_codon:yes gene_type:complete